MLVKTLLDGEEQEKERKKEKKKGKSNRDQCSVLHNDGTGPLCIFPGLKRQNLPFQGTGSSEDMAAVMKGIELDTFVRTHI